MSRRYGHGLVIGKFYPPHAGHHYLIDVAAGACERLTVVVAPASHESIPLDARCSWLRERHPGVEVVGVYDDVPVDYDDPEIWAAHCALFRTAAGVSTVDAVFSSEPYGDELARRFSAVHVCVDPPRAAVPVSGRAVRADPVGHWGYLTPPVRAWFVRRVVVVGAESTGTTTLARDLAERYAARGGVWAGTRWVPEYGRELTARKLAVLRERDPAASVFDVRWDRAISRTWYGHRTRPRTWPPVPHRLCLSVTPTPGPRRCGRSATSAPPRPRCGPAPGRPTSTC